MHFTTSPPIWYQFWKVVSALPSQSTEWVTNGKLQKFLVLASVQTHPIIDRRIFHNSIQRWMKFVQFNHGMNFVPFILSNRSPLASTNIPKYLVFEAVTGRENRMTSTIHSFVRSSVQCTFLYTSRNMLDQWLRCYECGLYAIFSFGRKPCTPIWKLDNIKSNGK